MEVRKLSLTISRPPSQQEPAARARSVHSVSYTRVVSYFKIGKRHQFSEIPPNIPATVYWFARHSKQPTPGKTSAKATLVSGDTVWEWWWHPADVGTKLTCGFLCLSVCICCVSEREGTKAFAGHSWFGHGLLGLSAPPAWETWWLPETSTPCGLLPVDYLCSTFFWSKTACLCGFAVEPTSFVSLNSKMLQKQLNLQVTYWEEIHKSERNGGKRQLYLHQDLCLHVLPLGGTHTTRH